MATPKVKMERTCNSPLTRPFPAACYDSETREERRGTNSQYEKSVSVAAEEGEAAAAVMTPSPYGAPSH